MTVVYRCDRCFNITTEYVIPVYLDIPTPRFPVVRITIEKELGHRGIHFCPQCHRELVDALRKYAMREG